jgi:hypothetical protein
LPWLDEWEIRPGQRWQRILQEQISNVSSAAVFVGPDGIAPWQDIEIESFLIEFRRRDIPVIPVILPECEFTPQLPLFLSGFQWVDFRKRDPEPISQLVWGITGYKPQGQINSRIVEQIAGHDQNDLIDSLRLIIREENDAIRISLAEKLDETTGTIINQLTNSQIAVVNSLYEATTSHQVQKDDFKELFDAIAEINTSLPNEHSLAKALADAAPVIEDTKANINNRLKVTLPIIPLLLSYEGEYELSSSANIVSILTRITARLRRK